MLKRLEKYRRSALIHVVAALHALRTLSDDLEDLRERVSAPDFTGSRIPVEVHMKSIRSGLERLKLGRVKAEEKREIAMDRILNGVMD
jgi:hypothetical protein